MIVAMRIMCFLRIPVSLSVSESYLPLLIMPGRSPKRKDSFTKKSMKNQSNLKSGSDYRLVIVLGGAIILAIAIIIAIMWTTR
jgi:hypothetical protein